MVYKARPRRVAPLHPGRIAAGALDECGMSVRAAATRIGMSLNGLAKVLRGESPVTPETAVRFGKFFGNGDEIWLRMQTDYDLWHARAALREAVKAIKPLEQRR